VVRQPPLPWPRALAALARCAATTGVLLTRGAVHLPSDRAGLRLRFPDGTSAVVYRETVLDRTEPADPCVLVVSFRLRGVRGRAHRYFRWVSLFNTPLFVGFPGFVSKLWLAHDERGRYRGLYQWDGDRRAEEYVRALWWALVLVSRRDSIEYELIPNADRDDVLAALVAPGSRELVRIAAGPGATAPGAAVRPGRPGRGPIHPSHNGGPGRSVEP
jgi:hypothetical protein